MLRRVLALMLSLAMLMTTIPVSADGLFPTEAPVTVSAETPAEEPTDVPGNDPADTPAENPAEEPSGEQPKAETPDEENQPVEPETPTEPQLPGEEDTTAPSESGEGETPDVTDAPTETELPGEDGEPVETDTPEETEAPDEENQPVEPETPTEPQQPGEEETTAPSESGEGETPDVTDAPTETELPDEDGEPVETETPGEDGEPVETETPGEDGEPVETEEPEETEQPEAEPLEVALSAGVRSAFAGDEVRVNLAVSGGWGELTAAYQVVSDGELVAETEPQAITGVEDAYVFTPAAYGDYSVLVTVTDELEQIAQASVTLPVAEHDTTSAAQMRAKAMSVILTEDWREDLVAVAGTQSGYRESETDFIIDENGDRQGYTVYGDEFGAPYGEWSVMFVSYALKYAGVPANALPQTGDMTTLWTAASNKGALMGRDYLPAAGDLVVFNRQGEASLVGIVTGASDNDVATIEGNSNKAVARRSYLLSDPEIVGYVSMEQVMLSAGVLALEEEEVEEETEEEVSPYELGKLYVSGSEEAVAYTQDAPYAIQVGDSATFFAVFAEPESGAQATVMGGALSVAEGAWDEEGTTLQVTVTGEEIGADAVVLQDAEGNALDTLFVQVTEKTNVIYIETAEGVIENTTSAAHPYELSAGKAVGLMVFTAPEDSIEMDVVEGGEMAEVTDQGTEGWLDGGEKQSYAFAAEEPGLYEVALTNADGAQDIVFFAVGEPADYDVPLKMLYNYYWHKDLETGYSQERPWELKIGESIWMAAKIPSGEASAYRSTIYDNDLADGSRKLRRTEADRYDAAEQVLHFTLKGETPGLSRVILLGPGGVEHTFYIKVVAQKEDFKKVFLMDNGEYKPLEDNAKLSFGIGDTFEMKALFSGLEEGFDQTPTANGFFDYPSGLVNLNTTWTSLGDGVWQVHTTGVTVKAGFTKVGLLLDTNWEKAVNITVSDDAAIRVRNIKIGNMRYSDVDVHTATQMFNGVHTGRNSESNRYPVYVHETLQLAADVGEGCAFYVDDTLMAGPVTGTEALTLSYTGSQVGGHTIELRDANGAVIQIFYITVEHPIYVETQVGDYHMHTVQEYIPEALGGLPAWSVLTDPNGTRLYVKNAADQPYLTYFGDQVTLIAYSASGNQQFTWDASKFEAVSGPTCVQEGGFYKYTLQLQAIVNPEKEVGSAVTFGGTTFHINIRPDYDGAHHFDIEIADGATYVFTAEDVRADGKTVIETVYDSFVSDVNECTIYLKDGSVRTIPHKEYYKQTDEDQTQFEVTSAWDLDANGNIRGVKWRNIPAASVERVVFDVALYLVPKYQKITEYDANGNVIRETIVDASSLEPVSFDSEDLEMGAADIIAARNKCPSHSGFDFVTKGQSRTVAYYGDLVVSKKVTGENLTNADLNKEFTFKVTLSDTSINGWYSVQNKDMFFVNGVATFKLKHGQSIKADNLPAGIAYTVTEESADGFSASGTNTTGRIQPGMTATVAFNNVKEKAGAMVVRKTVEGSAAETMKYFTFTVTLKDDQGNTLTNVNGKYGDMTFTNGVATFRLRHGQSKTATGLPIGVKYEVVETDNKGYEVYSHGATGEVPANLPSVKVDFLNVKNEEPSKTETKIGSNKTSQTGVADDDALLFPDVMVGDEITYEIKWENTARDEVSGELEEAIITITDPLDQGVDYVGSDPQGVYDDGEHKVVWTINAKAGESGVVKLTVRVNANARVKGEVDNTASVQVGQNDAQQTETVRNRVTTGDLVVYKTVEGSDCDTTESFTFKVTLYDKKDGTILSDFNGTYDDMTFEGGIATFTLKHGDRAIATGLPSGIYYTVEETNSKDYTVYKSGETGSIPKEDTAEAKFLNVKDKEPHKTETNHGAPIDEGTNGEIIYEGVIVGSTIDYEITWENTARDKDGKPAQATVKIEDKLDPGVDFVSAAPAGKYVYDEVSHTVTWTLTRVAPNATGSVKLTVKVNQKAFDEGEHEGKVDNTASVQVNNDTKKTETVENTTWKPEKKETTPGEGELVQVGERITYTISWKNYKADNATVVITDKLDDGLDFFSADNGGVYNEDTRTVTWNLGEKEAGKEGIVTLVVTVNAKAVKEGKVENQASVQVGHDPKQDTEIIENPTPEAKKEAVTSSGSEAVQAGDQITYTIDWKNHLDETATIKITDRLDKNVKYVSSDPMGDVTTNDEGQTVITWELGEKNPGDTGTVKLVVEVLGDVDKTGEVRNQATVTVNNFDIETNEVTNPTKEPEKHETKINDDDVRNQGKTNSRGFEQFPMVKPGDKITYEITWKNYKMTEKAEVTVIDRLDENVKFVDAYINDAPEGDERKGVTYYADAHMVVWKLGEREGGDDGIVTLIVEVLESAKKPGLVRNQASTKVGNDDEVWSDWQENPVPDPNKTETKINASDVSTKGVRDAENNKLVVFPGVQVGDEITYEISWWNYKTTAANITIIDMLDKNVQYMEGSANCTVTGGTGTVDSFDATHDANARTVTWKLNNVSPGAKGTVTLRVKVLEDALQSKGGPDEVVNEASVQVDNDAKIDTDKIENPVGDPHKTETEINKDTDDHKDVSQDGVEDKTSGKIIYPGVQVGDTITYTIEYKNYKTTAASVIITDKLDVNVEFVGAEPDGVYEYDKAEHTVIWEIPDVAAETSGEVTLTVRVLEGALQQGYVDNTAEVQVGNDPKHKTETDENPVWEPHKKETKIEKEEPEWSKPKNPSAPTKDQEIEYPGVQVGEEITYEISYRNYTAQKANITITDKLDSNVEFVSASKPGAYDKAAHTVTWLLPDVEPSTVDSFVTVTVRVLKGALTPGKVKNQASVKVGSDPDKKTETVENPVWEPHKTESELRGKKPAWSEERTPAGTPTKDKEIEFPGAQVGDKITYRISWKNFTGEKATIVITDPLDQNVKYIGADFNGKAKEPRASESTVSYHDHTVTWTMFEVPANAEGYVTVTVEVLEGALTPGVVDNQASVKVGNHPDKKTETVENPVWEPHKTESEIGGEKTTKVRDKTPDEVLTANKVLEFPGVQVGDIITYEITWENYTAKAQNIMITDMLDQNVRYVDDSAAFAGGYDYSKIPDRRITYDDHTVTWTMKNVPAGAKGTVTVKVEVLEGALTPGMVDNQASVKVGSDPVKKTETVENPVWEPHKTETKINGEKPEWSKERTPEGTPTKDKEIEFPGVQVGDLITYRVSWKNYHGETANVIITDPLDKNVKYISADFDGKATEAKAKKSSVAYSGHTVTWTLEEVPAGAEGYVTVTVEVLEGALTPGMVDNQASVKVGNDPAKKTETVENPVWEPHKTEPTPGDGEFVKPGEEITYNITWKNYKGFTATVTITDPLDKNVEFVSASDSGVYNKDTHTVVWTLKEQAAGASGKVTLVVRVKASALQPGHVDNQAGVQVGNDPEMKTEVVENPTWEPHKTESAINGEEPEWSKERTPEGTPTKDKEIEFPGVQVGALITYRISWKNYHGEAANIIVKDPLDKNVKYVSADFDGQATEAKAKKSSVAYSGHTVTWTLEEVPAGAEGYVTVTVEVLEGALTPGVVDNQASVKVGNDPEKKTETVENPVWEPHKTEPKPGDGELVKPGDEITYNITWKNYKGETATVTITDPLDKNVEFVSASDSGVYNKDTHTVVWTLKDQAADASGKVTLVVRVKDSALEVGHVDNQAGVQVGNDPEMKTEVVENPSWEPHKTEPDPGDNEPVQVGDLITYRITWKNYKEESATITITDPLDNGVNFMSASHSGSYDEASHTVTWTLKDVESGKEGYVELVVRVNRQALSAGKVVNQASVKVGNDPKMDTEIIENPTSEPTPEPTDTPAPTNTPIPGPANTPVPATETPEPTPTPEPARVSVSGQKTWEDNDDAAGLRPEAITVQLLRDGAVVEEKRVTAADNWRYTFAELLEVDPDTEIPYVYTINERMVTGYYTRVEGYNLVNVLLPGMSNGPQDPNNPDRLQMIPTYRTPLGFGVMRPMLEELQELIDLFGYGTPLWGPLLGTGREIPVYPFAFAGVGMAAVIALVLAERKKRKRTR